MEDDKLKKNEYSKACKEGRLRRMSPLRLQELKKAKALCSRIDKMKKKHSSLQEKYNLIFNGCQNCKRKEPYGENIGNTPYVLRFKWHAQNTLIKRKHFRFVEIDKNSDENIGLCLECSEYISNHDPKVGYIFENVWPSFVWNLLSDENILDVYGDYTWIFIPWKWRHWWVDSVTVIESMRDVGINNPPPIFKDITVDIEEMKLGSGRGKNSNIMKACDKHLLPTVLCPWGESEFIHKCGDFPYDCLVQRYLPKCYVKKVSDDKLCEKIYSSRDDYIREETEDYDHILLHPSWVVQPSVLFVEGKVHLS